VERCRCTRQSPSRGERVYRDFPGEFGSVLLWAYACKCIRRLRKDDDRGHAYWRMGPKETFGQRKCSRWWFRVRRSRNEWSAVSASTIVSGVSPCHCCYACHKCCSKFGLPTPVSAISTTASTTGSKNSDSSYFHELCRFVSKVASTPRHRLQCQQNWHLGTGPTFLCFPSRGTGSWYWALFCISEIGSKKPHTFRRVWIWICRLTRYRILVPTVATWNV